MSKVHTSAWQQGTTLQKINTKANRTHGGVCSPPTSLVHATHTSFLPDVQHPSLFQGIRFALPRKELNLPRSDEQIARWRREGLHVQMVTRVS